MQFADETLVWEYDQERILELSMRDKKPFLLRLQGLTFEIESLKQTHPLETWLFCDLKITGSSTTFEVKVSGPEVVAPSTCKAILMLEGTDHLGFDRVQILLVKKTKGRDDWERFAVATGLRLKNGDYIESMQDITRTIKYKREDIILR
jgi:hypothetical protein